VLLDELSTKVGYYLFSFNMMDVMLKIKLKSSEYGFSLCFVGFVGYASCVKCRVIRMLLECLFLALLSLTTLKSCSLNTILNIMLISVNWLLSVI